MLLYKKLLLMTFGTTLYIACRLIANMFHIVIKQRFGLCNVVLFGSGICWIHLQGMLRKWRDCTTPKLWCLFLERYNIRYRKTDTLISFIVFYLIQYNCFVSRVLGMQTKGM